MPSKNRTLQNATQMRYQARLRALVLERLGGMCNKCGFEDKRALQIDHVNGGGGQELKKTNGAPYYNLVLKSLLLEERRYQLLCANCNWIKRWEGNECGGRPLQKVN